MKIKLFFSIILFSLFFNVLHGVKPDFLNVTNFRREAKTWLWLANQYNSDLSKIFSKNESDGYKPKELVRALDVMSKALNVVDILCEAKRQNLFESKDLEVARKMIDEISGKVDEIGKFKIDEFDPWDVSKNILEVLGVIKVFGSFTSTKDGKGQNIYLTEEPAVKFLICLKSRKILKWINDLGIDLGFNDFKIWLEKRRQSIEGNLQAWKNKAKTILDYLKKQKNCLVKSVNDFEECEKDWSNVGGPFVKMRIFYKDFINVLVAMTMADDNLLSLTDSGDFEAMQLNTELYKLFKDVENFVMDEFLDKFLKHGFNWEFFSWFVLEDLGEVILDEHATTIKFFDDGENYLLTTHSVSWYDYKLKIRQWMENIKSGKIREYFLSEFDSIDYNAEYKQRSARAFAQSRSNLEEMIDIYTYLPMPDWVIPRSPRDEPISPRF